MAPRICERSRTPSPAAAIELARANNAEVPMTFQPAPSVPPSRSPPSVSVAIELTAVADRLERLGAGPQVQAECERLRRLARSASR